MRPKKKEKSLSSLFKKVKVVNSTDASASSSSTDCDPLTTTPTTGTPSAQISSRSPAEYSGMPQIQNRFALLNAAEKPAADTEPGMPSGQSGYGSIPVTGYGELPSGRVPIPTRRERHAQAVAIEQGGYGLIPEELDSNRYAEMPPVEPQDDDQDEEYTGEQQVESRVVLFKEVAVAAAATGYNAIPQPEKPRPSSSGLQSN